LTYQSFFMRSASAVAVSSVIGAAVFAASPEAGSVIGNQAVATYTNSAGDTITVTSNTVETIVQQVAGVTMTSDNTETIAPGGKAFLPHIITNEGNGPDSFDLTAVENSTGTLDTTQLIFYPDANLDGVADSATPLTSTPTLGAGEQFGVVIEATVASSASGSETILVTAASTLDGAETVSNTDTLTVSTGAIVELVKSMVADAGSGGNTAIVDAGDTVTVTLTYSSTGLTSAVDYLVEDVLDTDLIYVPGSATWSDSAGALDDDNATTVVDGTNGSSETIIWDYDDAQTVNFLLSEVRSGRSGRVTFQATIASTANAGIIPNVATQQIDGDPDFPPSNTASVRVDNQYAVAIADTAINDDGSPNAAIFSATDDDTNNDDIVTENSQVTYQGGTIKHEFVLTNLSNQADSLSLQVSNVDYPTGTTFRFVGADGVTPVIGSVGPLAIGASAKVTLIATLPTDVAPVATADYTATVTTTSDGSGASDTSTAEFNGAVLASSVDLENSDTTGDGANPLDPAGDPWITYTTDPGDPVIYDMVVQNNGPVSDSYNLSLAQPLPAGWTAAFLLPDGSVVTNTGTIPAGGSQAYQVVITPSDLAPPADTLIDIAIESAVSGQGDRIVNQVTVNEVYNVEIIDDQSAQASPGGIVDMLHTITNSGNVDITEGAISIGGLTNFSGALFWDANANGVIDAGETVIDNFDDLTDGVAVGTDGLASGDSISVIYRVQTPSTATPGVSEIGTITLASLLNGVGTDADTTNNDVEDRVTIISGDMTLTKLQYVDPLCTGAVGTFTKNRQNVEPGQCIRYRIVAENTGTSTANNVTISDAAPAYTAVTNCGAACAEAVTPPTATATITATGISSVHGSVIPGEFATLEFTVQVDE